MFRPTVVSILQLLAVVLLLLAPSGLDGRTLPNGSKQVKVYNYVLPAGAEEIRDDISHSFACANRSDGFYVDIDNDCQIFHRCQDRARFSFICAERTVFSQMYQTCVHDGQLGYPCEESTQFYPDGAEYPGEEANVNAPEPDAAVMMGDRNAVENGGNKNGELTMAPVEAVPVQDQAQVNADLYDAVDEEEEQEETVAQESENTAQEVTDEVDPVPMLVPEVLANAIPEDSQEVEVTGDGENEPLQVAPSQPMPSEDEEEEIASVVQIENELQEDQQPEQGPSVASSLQHEVQTIDELEPVVQDIATDVAQGNEAEQEELSSDHVVAATTVADSTDSDATLNEVHVEYSQPQMALANGGDEEESEQKVSEPLVMAAVESSPVAADDSAQAEVAPVPIVESDATVASSQHVEGEKEEAEEEEEEAAGSADMATTAVPSDDGQLPELIVSTEFQFDRTPTTVGPVGRRRKTFLFRADAIRST